MLLVVGVALALTPEEVLAEVEAQDEFRKHRTAPAPKIPESARKKAAKGETVAGVNLPAGFETTQGWGVAIWDAPVEAVWKAINNEDEASDYLVPAYSGTVDGTAHHSDRATFQYLDAPMLTDRWWITRRSFNEKLYTESGGQVWEVSFVEDLDTDLLDGTEFEELLEDSVPIAWGKGGYLVIPLSDGRTWVEYFTWSDPGGNVPAGLFSKFADREVLATFEGVAARAEYHETSGATGYVRPDGSSLD